MTKEWYARDVVGETYCEATCWFYMQIDFALTPIWEVKKLLERTPVRVTGLIRIGFCIWLFFSKNEVELNFTVEIRPHALKCCYTKKTSTVSCT